jgi:hypothetical protein
MTATASVFKSSGACSDTSLPILYRDPAASAGSLFCYDALDTYSWPSQAAPVGAATLVDLLDVSDASIGATAMGWANGFVFDSADTDSITLPVSSKFASDTAGFAIAVWVKLTSVAAGIVPLFGLGDDNASSQYVVYRDAATLVARVDGTAMGPQAVAADVVYQLGITSVLTGGSYVNTFWLDGVAVKTNTTAAPMAVPATMTACKIGTVSFMSVNGAAFTFYRAHADNLTTRTAAEFIAADYTAGVGRFA